MPFFSKKILQARTAGQINLVNGQLKLLARISFLGAATLYFVQFIVFSREKYELPALHTGAELPVGQGRAAALP
jgi:hypothetical protein